MTLSRSSSLIMLVRSICELWVIIVGLLHIILAAPVTTEGPVGTQIYTNSTDSDATVSTTILSVKETGTKDNNVDTKRVPHFITVENESLTALEDMLELSPDFMYVTFNLSFSNNYPFDNPDADYSLNVTDPYTLTWDRGEVGNFIRRLPSNFFYFSLNTFTPSVSKITFNVLITSPQPFIIQTDFIKQLSESLKDAFLNLTQNNFKICHEIYDHNVYIGTVLSCLLSLHVYIYHPSAIRVQCLCNDDTYELQDRFESSIWLTTLFYTVTILGAFYFPTIVMKIAIQKRPPVVDHSEDDVRIDMRSQLPLGLHYFVFIWGSREYPVLLVIRMWVGIAALFGFAHLQDLILRVTDDRYLMRVNSAYNSVVDKRLYYISTGLIFVAFVPIVSVFIYERFLRENDNFCIERKDAVLELLNPFRFRNFIPEVNDSLPWINKFHHFMKYRMIMAFDKRIIWYHPFRATLKTIQDRKDQEEKQKRTCGCTRMILVFLQYLILLVKVVIVLPYSLLLLIIYSPSSYVLIWCWWYVVTEIHRLWIKRRKRKVKIMILILLLPCCPLVFVSYSRVVIGIVSLVGHSVEFTFSGFILNIEHLNPHFYIIFSIVSFVLSAIRNFYGSYRKFFVIIIEEAIKHDETVCPERKVTKFATISNDLFWHIIKKAKPVRTEALNRVLQLVIVTFITLSAFDVLSEVQRLGRISKSTQTILSVAFTIILPFINPSLIGREEKQRHDAEDALEEYVKKRGEKIQRDKYQNLCSKCLTKLKQNMKTKYEVHNYVDEMKGFLTDMNIFPKQTYDSDSDEIEVNKKGTGIPDSLEMTSLGGNLSTSQEDAISEITEKIEQICSDFDIDKILPSNSLSLCTQRYNILLTKEHSEIVSEKVATQGLTFRETINRFLYPQDIYNPEQTNKVNGNQRYNFHKVKKHQRVGRSFQTLDEVQHILDLFYESDKSGYEDTIAAATHTFQRKIQKAVTKMRYELRTERNDHQAIMLKFEKAVGKYLKALYERDLKILRGLILQHLLSKQAKQEHTLDTVG